MFIPGEHEKTFPINPIGVKYICEHCGEGEMITDTSAPIYLSMPSLIKHKCDKCGKELLLPKSYPYIEWITNDSI